MASEARDLLRRLSAADERSLQSVLAPTPEFDRSTPFEGLALDRRTRVLVRLAALLAVDAPTATLRWAAELAASTGAGDDVLVCALTCTAAETGTAQLVRSAPRLALALGFDAELEDGDGA
jgi:hypothetical protein